MTVLVTGAAGFIGYHVSAALLARGERVIGVDNLNPYYSVALKRARLKQLQAHKRFAFHRVELARPGRLEALVKRARGVDRVVHLAAQAGVRYSLDHPRAYVESNLVAQLEVMETCRALNGLKHFVYASSSSVYGRNAKLPFAEDDRVETPQSLYAATKRADELMAYCYAHLYRMPTTGLRFFTVYGPWGRPDMAYWLFAEAIERGKPIKLFNEGRMRRDFTYIDDVVEGVLAALDRPPADGGPDAPPHQLYNLGNNRAEDLDRFVSALERALGKTAKRQYLPMQKGDVPATYADVTAARRDLSFAPRTAIDEGLRRFVDWYRDYHKRR
ncbi:MAG: NAD-dependent epimerase/dehydratase family protein [Alphaproteobacteria bacterium]|nr:NAD-dependent epimerase/dehydratase family protein [Alphaproteobacteria bacterium]